MVRAQSDATVQTIDYLLQFIQAINIDVEITALSKEFTLSIGEVIFRQSDSKSESCYIINFEDLSILIS